MKIERDGVLDDVLIEDYLELPGGKVVRNLKELVIALETMSDEDFSLHVYGNQNDFAEWAMEAYWDEELTGKILGISNRKKMIKALKDVLKKAERERFSKNKKEDILQKIKEL